MERRVLANGFVVTMSHSEPEKPFIGWVCIEGDKIALVTPNKTEAEAWIANSNNSVEVIDCSGCAVMPGLINTHSHISMTLLRNYADDMELNDWLNNHIWPFEAHLTEEDIYNGARLAIVEMIQSGTTTFVDMYFQEHIIAKAVEELGIRALLTETLLDFNRDDFTQRMDKLLAVAEKSNLVMAGVAPHAPYTCDPKSLKIVADYAAQHNLPLTIHLSETAGERALIEERYGVSPLQYLIDNNIVTEKTILAHAIYLDSNEIKTIAKLGASVAHNAQSNMKLASGIAPIAEMQRNNVVCSIATDGPSSNNDLDMWDEMRSAALLQRVATLSPTALSAYEVLYSATRGGAKAIGKENQLGALIHGYNADVIVVDLSGVHNQPLHNIISALVYSVKSTDVRNVFVNGSQILFNSNSINSIISAAHTSTIRILHSL